MGPIRNPRWEQKRTEGYVIVSRMFAHQDLVFNIVFGEYWKKDLGDVWVQLNKKTDSYPSISPRTASVMQWLVCLPRENAGNSGKQ